MSTFSSIVFISGLLAMNEVGHVEAQPITMQVEEQSGKIRVTVVGNATSATTAPYTLRVLSSGNQSVQGGRASLIPGKPATLIDLTVSTAAADGWEATLDVAPEEGAAYRVARSHRDAHHKQ